MALIVCFSYMYTILAHQPYSKIFLGIAGKQARCVVPLTYRLRVVVHISFLNAKGRQWIAVFIVVRWDDGTGTGCCSHRR